MRAFYLTTAIAALALAGCGDSGGDAAPAAQPPAAEAPAPAQPAPAPAPTPAAIVIPENINRAVASDERTPEMRERDANRKPAELLALAGVREGDQIVEFAGFGQYFTTILAEAVGPQGKVSVYDLPYTEERSGEASRAFASAHANMDYNVVDYNAMELPSNVDGVHIVLYYHDLPLNSIDVAAFNRKVYDALKPGGVYLIVDHNAPAGSGVEYIESAHRIDPQVIRDEVTAAGFVLETESDLLRNPEDDLTSMVFTPGVRGTTDQSVFVFRKPQ